MDVRINGAHEGDKSLYPLKKRGKNGDIYNPGNAGTYDSDTIRMINAVAGLRLLNHPPINRDATKVVPVNFKTTLIFNASESDGKKALMNDNQDIYLGDFQNSVPNGKGALILSDGSTYQGNWLNGKAQGSISITLPYGFTGVGQWKDGIPDYDTLMITRPNRTAAPVSKSDNEGKGQFWG